MPKSFKIKVKFIFLICYIKYIASTKKYRRHQYHRPALSSESYSKPRVKLNTFFLIIKKNVTNTGHFLLSGVEGCPQRWYTVCVQTAHVHAAYTQRLHHQTETTVDR